MFFITHPVPWRPLEGMDDFGGDGCPQQGTAASWTLQPPPERSLAAFGSRGILTTFQATVLMLHSLLDFTLSKGYESSSMLWAKDDALQLSLGMCFTWHSGLPLSLAPLRMRMMLQISLAKCKHPRSAHQRS